MTPNPLHTCSCRSLDKIEFLEAVGFNISYFFNRLMNGQCDKPLCGTSQQTETCSSKCTAAGVVDVLRW